jgi:HAD superfamily hydrolase (TIGR01662 family)
MRRAVRLALRGSAAAPISRRARRVLRRRSHAILFDREGALVSALPASGEPGDLRLRADAAAAVARARSAGVGIAVVASADREGLADGDEQVNARVTELVGHVDVLVECPHAEGEECLCHKPAPGLIYLAAAALGTRPQRCVVIGDVGADVDAAQAAGARVILVPSARTSSEDLEAAPVVASSVDEAVAIALGEAA